MNANGQPAPNRLKRNLAAGKVCLGATITINSPAVAEIMSHIGLDWLWFETEHSSLTLDNVLTMLQATNGADISTVIRHEVSALGRTRRRVGESPVLRPPHGGIYGDGQR